MHVRLARTVDLNLGNEYEIEQKLNDTCDDKLYGLALG